MKKLLLLVSLFLFPVFVTAQETQTVYQEIIFEDLTGNQLLDSLAYYYTTSSVEGYNGARDIMFTEVYNVNNTVECVYTGDVISLNANSTSPRQDAINQGFNTEHVWPQSRGATGNARSDMHHLRPTRTDVNSSRGNFPIGLIEPNLVTRWFKDNVNQANTPSGDLGLWSRTGNNKFQPRDEYAGDTARAMFYFYTIYRDQADSADPNFFVNQYEELREMHNMQPVTQLEVDRSFMIAAYQNGKVNPFVVDTTLIRRAFFEDFDPGVNPPDDPEEGGDYFVDFEVNGEDKPSYSPGNVQLAGINWNFSNALIQGQTGDMKFGLFSARLRRETSGDPATITMLQDKTEGLGVVSFYYARSLFSNDRNGVSPSFVVEYSLNQGQSWTQIGETVNLANVDQLTLFSAEIATEQDGRIRIRTISGDDGKRFNIDNISISNFPYETLPVIGDVTAVDVTDTELTLSATIDSNGGKEVTERGFIYAERLINDDPVLEDDDIIVVQSGEGTGEFTADLSNLNPDTEYALRAYAINEIGTIYSEALYVTTLLSSSISEPTDTPQNISLHQNYPNPFNPTTQIQFELPVSGEIQLAVYDVTGRRIATLANEFMSAGTHTFTFNASALSSGVYLYRLQADGIVLSKKMTLVK